MLVLLKRRSYIGAFTMETTKIPVSFRCKRCDAKLTWSEDAIDSTDLFCQCGQYFGTYADLKHTALEGVRSKVESMLKDTFERS
jgi:hypothetical protein